MIFCFLPKWPKIAKTFIAWNPDKVIKNTKAHVEHWLTWKPDEYFVLLYERNGQELVDRICLNNNRWGKEILSDIDCFSYSSITMQWPWAICEPHRASVTLFENVSFIMPNSAIKCYSLILLCNTGWKSCFILIHYYLFSWWEDINCFLSVKLVVLESSNCF